MTPIERAAYTADQLRAGRTLTAAAVARETGCKVDTARRMLNKLPNACRQGQHWVHIQFAGDSRK